MVRPSMSNWLCAGSLQSSNLRLKSYKYCLNTQIEIRVCHSKLTCAYIIYIYTYCKYLYRYIITYIYIYIHSHMLLDIPISIYPINTNPCPSSSTFCLPQVLLIQRTHLWLGRWRFHQWKVNVLGRESQKWMNWWTQGLFLEVLWWENSETYNELKSIDMTVEWTWMKPAGCISCAMNT